MYKDPQVRIGYCTLGDPWDKRSWSGINFYAMKALEKNGFQILSFGPMNNKYIPLMRAVNKISRRIFGKGIDLYHCGIVSKEYARLLKDRIRDADVDILFFVSGGVLSAFCDFGIPIISLFDITMKQMVNYYPSYSKILNISKKACIAIDTRAVKNSAKIIYTSQWAAEFAVSGYGYSAADISVIHLGANMDKIPPREEILLIRNQRDQKLKLLFVGVDWHRKGGDIAFQTLLELNKKGVDAELMICGCSPPDEIRHDKIRLIGFLDKNKAEDAVTLDRLYKEASLFFLPTRYECAGVVFSEAAAYGLPVISCNTGGVSSYVEENRTGYLLDSSSTCLQYADTIRALWQGKFKYYELCKNSRDRYESELNWDIWGKKVSSIINELKNKHVEKKDHH